MEYHIIHTNPQDTCAYFSDVTLSRYAFAQVGWVSVLKLGVKGSWFCLNGRVAEVFEAKALDKATGTAPTADDANVWGGCGKARGAAATQW